MTGYKEISFRKQKFTTANRKTGLTISGMYDRIEESFKAILVTGVVIDSVEYKPFFAETVNHEGSYELKGSDMVITVTDADLVTISKKEDE